MNLCRSIETAQKNQKSLISVRYSKKINEKD